MTTLYDSAAPVKSDRPFGTLPARERRMPHTQADLDWAARSFGDDADWDVRLAAGLETCEVCGRPVEPGELECGMCAVCMIRAEEASLTCQYYGAGMGWHTY
jgi:hypothetical protein